ncbi:uncharacterized protein MELLADRAFT_87489 [Melampsora larici-populina 98AG31]|uniref:Tet-like 2OG-Fe(II) oxygenase domain-containing protein n=1 Tax=Melampsora larici-populina (strain 98AG31 / pathotype 3-4-7) TaxID=747676 RepID=F4RNG9_MELLP|nr:uncharacterized protein MELLADRAFT_87489 [Melampsora larici-populina 98AG31]EGG05986.1 hypothetical protein MELLADRAFT_87489 [Melampsora larici-populina 98AG31]
MTKQKPKYRAKSTQLKRSKDHKDQLIVKNSEKKNKLHNPPPEPPTVASATQSRLATGLVSAKHSKRKSRRSLVYLPMSLLFIEPTMNGTKLIARLFKQFGQSVSTLYNHGIARNRITTNGPTVAPGKRKQGDMFAIGMRAGYRKGVFGGPYAISHQTALLIHSMEKDLRRQQNLPYIQNFLAGQFSSLSLEAYQSNYKIGAKLGLSWASNRSFNSPNGQAFGGNFVMTRDEWYNKAHKDCDATGYSYGLFGLIKRGTGKLYRCGSKSRHGYVKEGHFSFPEYNIQVSFEDCDGVVEMVWAMDVEHQTTESTTHGANGDRVKPRQSKITQFGSLCQVSKLIVQRINLILNKRSAMNEEEWVEYRESKVENYADKIKRKCQTHKKLRI